MGVDLLGDWLGGRWFVGRFFWLKSLLILVSTYKLSGIKFLLSTIFRWVMLDGLWFVGSWLGRRGFDGGWLGGYGFVGGW